MNRCHITDRRALGGVEPLLARIAVNDAAGVELIQIREKDLSARALCELVSRAVALCQQARVIVNTRVDVALACGAHGVHLPAHSPAPNEFRRIVPPGFVIGVSCHDLDELRAAESEGADYALFAPVFHPLSKIDPRKPIGLDGLRAACMSVRLPVYALGGITVESAPDCVQAGAAGIAGITLFQS
ncbi:MAG TPA: thiamine phosphate synthase [Paludibaculum sp.]|jgi:thiamine-phosphate pyrophosphorylase